MSYGNGIKLTTGFDVGAKTPLDSKSVVQTIAERDAFVTDNLVYEGLEVYVKDTGHKYRYNGTSWIDLDTQSGSESGTGEGLTTEQANQLTTAYEHSQTPHVSADDIPTNISDLTNDSGFITSSDLPTVPTKVSDLENDRGYLISIPEEYITETELEAKGYLTSHQDISNLQSKIDNNLATTSKEVVGAINEVKSSVDGITVPTKTSDLTNDSGFITSIPSEYITETELETKGYLTEHQSLTDYAKKTDIPDVSDFLTEVPAEYVTDTKLSTELDKKVNKEVGKGLSTNDLTNELVTKINSSATEAFVTNAIANAQLGSGEVDLSGYATIDALNLKADLTHTHDQYLTKVPDEYITETELTDKNYADKTYVTQAVKNVKVDLTGYAKTSDIPTKVSDLTNDSNFITSIPEEYITETELEAKGYLTSHQDISNLALKSEIPDVSSFITSDDLPTVPTKVSDLANDKNYISSIPSEYVTETELNAKGYLTEHQDISNLQTKTDKNLTTTSKEVVGAINELDTNKLDKPEVDGTAGQILVLQDDGSLAYEDNVGSGTTDLPEITNVLTNNSTINQIPNAKLVADEIHGKSISLADYSDALKIPTGKWRVDSTEKAGLMKNLPVSEAGILEVKYLHGNDETTVYTSPYKYAMFTYTVITGDKYERALSSGAAGSITRDTGWRKIINENSSELTDINTKLSQLETKANLIPVVADNPTDYDLNNYKENGNYSIGDPTKYSNTPISKPSLLTVIRSNSYRLQIYTVVNNDDVYFRKSIDWGKTWTSWVLLNGSSGASDNDIYTGTIQEIGTWMGKKLYKHSYHSIGTKTSIKDGTTSVTNVDKTKYELVKIEAVFRMGTDSSNIVTYQVPFVDFNKNASMIAFQDRDGMICFTAKNLSDYKDYGEDVTVYYTDK